MQRPVGTLISMKRCLPASAARSCKVSLVLNGAGLPTMTGSRWGRDFSIRCRTESSKDLPLPSGCPRWFKNITVYRDGTRKPADLSWIRSTSSVWKSSKTGHSWTERCYANRANPDYSCSEGKPRHSVGQGMSLEERRHQGVQGSMLRVQRFNSFWTLNIEL